MFKYFFLKTYDLNIFFLLSKNKQGSFCVINAKSPINLENVGQEKISVIVSFSKPFLRKVLIGFVKSIVRNVPFEMFCKQLSVLSLVRIKKQRL